MEAISSKNLQTVYRRYAPFYDWVFGAVLDPGRRKMAAAVAEADPDTLLEVGVGTGLSLSMYPEYVRVVGVDISEDMLKQARRRADRLPQHDIVLQAMDAERMGFPDGSFDCVTAPYVLSVTPNPQRLLAELQRVCRPGGLIVIVNHFSDGNGWSWAERLLKRFATHVGFRSEFSFDEHITGAGVAVESVQSANFLGLSKVVLIRNR